MHEMGMCQSVLEAVEQRAGGRRVDRIGVQVGSELRVVPEVFEQGFQMLAQGGVADGAGTELETVPGDGLMLVWLRYDDAKSASTATMPSDRRS